MVLRRIGLESRVSIILATFVIFLIGSCAPVYYGYFMKGSIIETSGSEVCLDIGSKHGATVGQELDVYKVIQLQITKVERHTFRREHTGRVKITEIIDEYFARAVVISGKAEKGNIVELVRPE